MQGFIALQPDIQLLQLSASNSEKLVRFAELELDLEKLFF